MIDGIDAKILTILQSDARASNASIAREVGLTASAVLERIRKLQNRGVLEGFEARIDPLALDLGLLAFVFVKTDESYGTYAVGEALAAIPEVQEVHHITGQDCYLVKVRAADPESLGRFCREKIGAIDKIRSTNTTVVLGTLKESGALPIPGAEPAAPDEAREDESRRSSDTPRRPVRRQERPRTAKKKPRRSPEPRSRRDKGSGGRS